MILLGLRALPNANTSMLTPMPAAPTGGTRATVSTSPIWQRSPQGCPSGYTQQDGVCISPGCISGRDVCVVVDAAGRTCSYDQMLSAWQATGKKQCPAPGGVQEESGHFTMPGTPGAMPIPGTQAMPPPLPLPGGQVIKPGVIDPNAVQQAYGTFNWKKLAWIALGLAAVGGGYALLKR